MRRESLSPVVAIIALLLVLPLAAQQTKTGQKQTDKKDAKSDAKAQPSSSPDKPKPLFEGKMTLKSSRRGADSATAGFNGIGDDGKVTKDALAAAPTSIDAVKANALVAYAPKPEELAKFLEEGKLNKAAPKPQPTTKKK